MSTNVGAGGGPVFGDGTLREGSAGRLGGNSVRGSITGDLSGGSVTDGSVGSVATRLPPAVQFVPPPEYFPQMPDEGGFTEAPAAPVYELQTLAERLRQVQPLQRNAPAAEDSVPEESPDEDTAKADEAAPQANPPQPEEESPSPADEEVAEPEPEAPAADDEEAPPAEDQPPAEEESTAETP